MTLLSTGNRSTTSRYHLVNYAPRPSKQYNIRSSTFRWPSSRAQYTIQSIREVYFITRHFRLHKPHDRFRDRLKISRDVRIAKTFLFSGWIQSVSSQVKCAYRCRGKCETIQIALTYLHDLKMFCKRILVAGSSSRITLYLIYIGNWFSNKSYLKYWIKVRLLL